MEKTVYILGAGFSRPAGFPLQKDLLLQAMDATDDILGDLSRGNLSASYKKPQEIVRAERRVRDFIKTVYGNHADPTLEDVFTLLDQVISEGAHFAKYTEHQARVIRTSWIHLILYALHQVSEEHLAGPKLRYRAFAALLISTRIKASQSGDPFSIISLNWDSLVEDSIYWVLKEVDAFSQGRALADIDYCVYTHPLADSPHMPSPKQKAAGIYNLKLLKMHGSATWLRCPCSNHIYTGLGSTIRARELYLSPTVSPFVTHYLDKAEKSSPSRLEPFLITPTFTKVFDQPHIKTTWHNAFVELRQADRIVFIGYSLPDADYHFRTLLRRAVRSSAVIEVILAPNDDPALLRSYQSGDDYLLAAVLRKISSTEDRYRQMFKPSNSITFRYSGADSFLESLAPAGLLTQQITELKQAFARTKGKPLSIPQRTS